MGVFIIIEPLEQPTSIFVVTGEGPEYIAAKSAEYLTQAFSLQDSASSLESTK